MTVTLLTRQHYGILSRCLSVDLEVDPKDARIFAFAAVPESGAEGILHRDGDLRAALEKLDLFCAGFAHVIGHNILYHDIPHLSAASPRFAKLSEAPIDTLWLNPLAFPRNPYHHLVKHYRDGRLQSGHVNDPEFDAALVFDVLRNQIDAFDALNTASPDILVAYHWLTCRGPRSEGFDGLFRDVRRAPIPQECEAHASIRRLLAGNACGAQAGARVSALAVKARLSGGFKTVESKPACSAAIWMTSLTLFAALQIDTNDRTHETCRLQRHALSSTDPRHPRQGHPNNRRFLCSTHGAGLEGQQCAGTGICKFATRAGFDATRNPECPPGAGHRWVALMPHRLS